MAAAAALVAVMIGCGSKDDEPKTILVTNITITGDASVQVGNTINLSAAVTPSDATNKNVTWSSDNPNFATVSAQGAVTGVSAGTATIRATATDGGGASATKSLTVVPNVIKATGIAITPSENVSIEVAQTTTFTATVSPTNASNKEIIWSSLNPNIATVDSKTGAVTGVSAGTATIRASAADGSGVTANKDVTVIPDYIALNQKLGDQIDYAILGLNGLGYFYEFQGEHTYIPQRLSIYDGNKRKTELVVNFDVNGLPINILSEYFTIILGKYEGNKFSAVLITKEGESHLFENIETEILWNEYMNGIAGAPTKAVSRDPFQWIKAGLGTIGCVLKTAKTIKNILLSDIIGALGQGGLALIDCGSAVYKWGQVLAGWGEMPKILDNILWLKHWSKLLPCLTGNDPDILGCVLSIAKEVASLTERLFNIAKEDISSGDNILKTGSNKLIITAPNYGDIYHCGQWININVDGYLGTDWEQNLELEYSCLVGEPRHTKNDEPSLNFPLHDGRIVNKATAYLGTKQYSFTFSPETPSVWDGHWVKLMAHNKKNGTWSDPQYIRITNPLTGTWDRGDMRVTIVGNNAVITQVNSGYWLTALNSGFFKIGDSKIRNITRTGSLTWSCQELWLNYSLFGEVNYIYWGDNEIITMNEAGTTFGVGGGNSGYTKVAQ